MTRNKYGYLAKNTLLFTVSSFSSKILSFLLVPLYTNVLSTADYGIADIVSTTSTLLTFVVSLNISESVLRFAIDNNDQQNDTLRIGMKIAIQGNFIFGILVIIAAWFNLFGWESNLYLFLFLSVFATTVMNVLSNYLRAVDKIKDVAIAGIVSTIVTILTNIITLLILRIGIIGYMLSMIFAPFSAAIYCLSRINISEIFGKEYKNNGNLRKEMIMYSLPLIVNSIAWWMNASIDKYFVVLMLGSASNGIYAVSQKIPTILTTFSTVFMQAWNLSAIKEYNQQDKDGFFSNTYNLLTVVLVLLCSVLILFNVPLARFLYAKNFFMAWECSSWLLASIVFSTLGSMVGSVFSAVKNSRVYSVSTISSAIINIAMNYFLIPIYNIRGAAIATVISFFVMWAIRYVCALKYIKLKTNIGKYLLCFALLIVQVMIEWVFKYGYVLQITLFAVLILLNLNELIFIVGKLRRVLFSKQNTNDKG